MVEFQLGKPSRKLIHVKRTVYGITFPNANCDVDSVVGMSISPISAEVGAKDTPS